jgi:hypothetical protein
VRQAGPNNSEWGIRVYVTVGFLEKKVTWTLGSHEVGIETCSDIMTNGGLSILQEEGGVKFFKVNKFELFKVK